MVGGPHVHLVCVMEVGVKFMHRALLPSTGKACMRLCNSNNNNHNNAFHLFI